MLFHIDALTGEDSTYASPADDLLQGLDVIAGSLVEADLIRDGVHKYVLLFDEFLQVRTDISAVDNLIRCRWTGARVSGYSRASTVLPETHSIPALRFTYWQVWSN